MQPKKELKTKSEFADIIKTNYNLNDQFISKIASEIEK